MDLMQDTSLELVPWPRRHGILFHDSIRAISQRLAGRGHILHARNLHGVSLHGLCRWQLGTLQPSQPYNGKSLLVVSPSSRRNIRTEALREQRSGQLIPALHGLVDPLPKAEDLLLGALHGAEQRALAQFPASAP